MGDVLLYAFPSAVCEGNRVRGKSFPSGDTWLTGQITEEFPDKLPDYYYKINFTGGEISWGIIRRKSSPVECLAPIFTNGITPGEYSR